MVPELEAGGKEERRNFSVISRSMKIYAPANLFCKIYPKHYAKVLPKRFYLNGNTKGI